MTSFYAAISLSYRKVLGQFSVSLFVLLCPCLQAFAQSKLPASPTREIRPLPIAQTNSTKFVAPTYLKVGKTVRGRDITAMIYGSGAKHVLVFGGIHGDEPHTTVVARSLAVHLNPETLPPNLTLIIVPDVNPDGLIAHTRVNANGVDINRNFPSKT
jgi:hypothetical protein